jgi:hypothetical protein
MLKWEDDVEAHALRKRGWTIRAIARHLRRDRKTICEYQKGNRRPGERAHTAPDTFAEYTESAGSAGRRPAPVGVDVIRRGARAGLPGLASVVHSGAADQEAAPALRAVCGLTGAATTRSSLIHRSVSYSATQMPDTFSRQIRSNSTSTGRLAYRPVNTLPLSLSTSAGAPNSVRIRVNTPHTGRDVARGTTPPSAENRRLCACDFGVAPGRPLANIGAWDSKEHLHHLGGRPCWSLGIRPELQLRASAARPVRAPLPRRTTTRGQRSDAALHVLGGHHAVDSYRPPSVAKHHRCEATLIAEISRRLGRRLGIGVRRCSDGA